MPSAYCAVVGCTNGDVGIAKWKRELCTVHNINFGVAQCICDPPYRLFTFPTEKANYDGRQRWIKLVCMPLLNSC